MIPPGTLIAVNPVLGLLSASAPPGFLSAAEYAEILAYNQPQYLLAAFSEPLNLLVIAVWVGVLVRPFHRWAQRLAGRIAQDIPPTAQQWAMVRLARRLWGGDGWGTALIFATFCSAFLALASMPVQVGFGYFHEHAHGVSRASAAAFAGGVALDFVERLGLRLVLVFGLYALARRVRMWWLVLGMVSAVGLLWIAALDPVRTSLDVPHHPLPPGALNDALRRLLARDHVPFSRIVVLESSNHTSKADAVFIGEGPTRQILLSDTLLIRFTAPQIVAAVAHEAGHAHEDRWPGRALAAVALFGFVVATHLLFRLAQRRAWFGATEYADIRTLPLITVLMYALLTFGIPVAAETSRDRELAADRHAVELTGDPEAFRGLLQGLARVNKIDPWPPTWFVWRGLTHPPLSERLAQVDALEHAAQR